MRRLLEQANRIERRVERVAVGVGSSRQSGRFMSRYSLIHHQRRQIGAQLRGVKPVGSVEWHRGIDRPCPPPGLPGGKTHTVDRVGRLDTRLQYTIERRDV